MKRKPRINEKSITMFLFSVPATILYLIFFIYPVGAGIYYSLTNWNGLTNNFKYIGLKNYINALDRKSVV